MARYLRKMMHAMLASLFVWGSLYLSAETLLVFSTVLLGIFVIAKYIRVLDPIRNAEVGSHGEFFFALGVLLSVLVFLPAHPLSFIAGMLVLGFADALAAVVGVRWGTHEYHIFGERRTYEGSSVALLVSVLVLFGCGMPIWLAGIGGWLLASVEALAPVGSDNLILPLLAGALMLFV